MPSVETKFRYNKESEIDCPVVVMKFGGTSVGSATAIENVSHNILKKHAKGNGTIVVVSAMSGVTNKLVEICDLLKEGNTRESEHVSREVFDMHFTTASELHLSPEKRSLLQEDLRKLITTMVNYRDNYTTYENPLQIRDVITSYGERLNARLVAASCEQVGIKAKAFDASSFIKTDDNHGSANPDYYLTRREVREKIVPELKNGVLPIVTGFIGSNSNGEVTTLGRGGSDYTATILGKVLSAREVWIWTDVNGVYASDPKHNPDAKLFELMSFTHADNMAKAGSKVLYPKTIEPLVDTNTLLRVRNSFDPDSGETVIVNDIKYLEGDD